MSLSPHTKSYTHTEPINPPESALLEPTEGSWRPALVRRKSQLEAANADQNEQDPLFKRIGVLIGII